MLNRAETRWIQAYEFIRENPGCSILPVARCIAPNQRLSRGYDPVHRLIETGWIVARKGRGNRYRLSIAPEVPILVIDGGRWCPGVLVERAGREAHVSYLCPRHGLISDCIPHDSGNMRYPFGAPIGFK